MKIIRSNSYRKVVAKKVENVESTELADAILAEMGECESRAIARVRAIENLTKNPNHYKKSKAK